MRTVLIIDDEPVDRFVAEQVIVRSEQGWKVVKFPDAIKALNFISLSIGHGGALPEIIVFDLLMPVTDGFEFVRSFNQLAMGRTDRSHLVMLTVSESRDRQKQALSLGVNTLLIKPLTPDKWSALSL